MKVIKRLCIKDFNFNVGDKVNFTIKKGEEYTTSTTAKNYEVIVHSRYWARVPLNIFEHENKSQAISKIKLQPFY